MPTLPPPDREERHRRLLAARSLGAVLDQPDGLALLAAEADDPEGLITHAGLAHLRVLREYRGLHSAHLGFIFSTDDVIVVPGFMGSTLSDVKGSNGLIWIDPTLVVSSSKLSALKLAPAANPDAEEDADPAVQIQPAHALPILYDLMTLDLEVRRYSVEIFPFDWRKNINAEARRLEQHLRARLAQKPRPLHVIAHSHGSLVARRAIQLLGSDDAHRLINTLVLLGPASFGTFAAAFAIAGSHEMIATIQNWGLTLPNDTNNTLQSFTGLYQLLPWKADTVGMDPQLMKDAPFWQSGVDAQRLKFGFQWAETIDTSFFNDRTSIILGDRPTIGAVDFNANKKLVEKGPRVDGDGVVPESCALLEGVRPYKAPGADHMMLPGTLSVLAAVRALLRGDAPVVERVAVTKAKAGVPRLVTPPSAHAPPPSALERAPLDAKQLSAPAPVPLPAPPPYRKLRVFSFDPLMTANLDTLGIAHITLEVPWESETPSETGSALEPGPVGEYLEVIDFDPASDCFYRPVDLNHPRLLAQDGLPPTQSNPQFHQQMTYAVAMATIDTFEKALGRKALWAPRLTRNEDGQVTNSAEEQFVRRLRIYPHAMREDNAYYDPDRHALLFGYFPSREQSGGDTLPGGTVFAAQSFDIVAHETTHALLHGLHRYFLDASNPDLLAFHEAFADAVALFQHFSHPEAVRDQVARSRGQLRHADQLGRLAQQFGRATGHRAALRDYLTKEPDATLLAETPEAHDRGAILMAALFRAFLNIYEHRAADLNRIATAGTGVLPDGDILADLVKRLGDEAAKSARHMLTMCVRALDYVPPVDLTFGEYLRALITADYDLVRDDDLGYRVAVIDAFSKWGIYPDDDVNVLDEAVLRWRTPQTGAVRELRQIISKMSFTDWNLCADRKAMFLANDRNAMQFRVWLYENARQQHDGGKSLGLFVFGDGYHSIVRNRYNSPKIEVHSLRPCCRIGPDGQQRTDLVAEVVQKRAGYFDPEVQKAVDAGPFNKGEKVKYWAFSDADAKEFKRTRAPQPDFWFRGGCTLIIDPESGMIRYCVRKSIRNDERLKDQRKFEQTGALPSLAATYFGTVGRNPLALLHRDDE